MPQVSSTLPDFNVTALVAARKLAAQTKQGAHATRAKNDTSSPHHHRSGLAKRHDAAPLIKKQNLIKEHSKVFDFDRDRREELLDSDHRHFRKPKRQLSTKYDMSSPLNAASKHSSKDHRVVRPAMPLVRQGSSIDVALRLDKSRSHNQSLRNVFDDHNASPQFGRRSHVHRQSSIADGLVHQSSSRNLLRNAYKGRGSQAGFQKEVCFIEYIGFLFASI